MQRRGKAPTGRRPGGQPGHKKRERALVPVERVDKFVDVRPETCDSCDRRLTGDDPDPRRHQVIDLPPMTPIITEYREHLLRCRCGATTRARWPEGVPRGVFGASVQSLVALLTAKFRLSKRLVRELLTDVLGVDVALGSVSNMEANVSAATAGIFDEAHAFVTKQPIVNADETSWIEARMRAWLWTAVTPRVTVYQIGRSRGSDSARLLLGADFSGVLGVDRTSWCRVSDEAKTPIASIVAPQSASPR